MQKPFNQVKIFTVCKPEIGSGHLIRSLLIKDALNSMANKIDIYGEFEKVPNHIKDINNIEFEQLNKFNFSNEDFIVIDTYIKRELFNSIDVKKFLIHDAGVDKPISNVIKIDFNLTSDSSIDKNNNIQGYEYFPIGFDSKPEFKSKENISNQISNKVLISLGGVSDESLVDLKKIADTVYRHNYEVFIADPSKKLSLRNDLKDYTFIHGKFLSNILNQYKFKFAIMGGGISKFVTISSGIPCIYIPRNKLENIHLNNIEILNLGFVLDKNKTIEDGMNYIENNYSIISNTSRQVIDGHGPKRLENAIMKFLN